MEMCPSTVWHLVSHYFVWCEGTINVMFTLKTLLGCVYVQLLTYEDVSVCITLTWSPRMHTNVQLKTRSHTCVHVFLTNTYLYPSLSYETHVCITYFPITLTEENVSTQLLTYKAAFLKNSLSWPTCLHAIFSTKRGEDQSEHSILSRDLSPASLKTSCSKHEIN